LTILERLRRWACSHPVGAQLDVTVRYLAGLVDCGPGAITPALRRLASDGLILYLAAPRGSLVEVLVSDVGRSDHDPDRSLLTSADPVRDHAASAPGREVRPKARQRGLIDQGRDRPPGTKELHDDQSKQQQHAREPVSVELNKAPAGLSQTEWATIRQLAPDYTAAQLDADLEKLAGRPGVRSPVGVLIAALRRGEPIWSREELRERNAAIAAHYAPSAPPAADLPPPRRPRSSSTPTPAPVEPVLHAPHGALWDYLILLMPDAELADWLCDGFSLTIQSEATVLHCRSADHAAVARDLRGLLVDALRDLGLPDTLEICAPEEAGQAAADHAPMELGADQGEMQVPPKALEVDHAPVAPLVEQLAALEAADHAPPAPEVERPTGQPARTPPPAASLVDHAAVPRPGAAPAAQRPITRPQPLPARSRLLAPPGPPGRPRRPKWSPWRAS
jgi:hypothetical protein